jgi:hypothetical protein
VPPAPDDAAWRAAVATRFSWMSREIADTIGASPLLAQVARAEHDRDPMALGLARARLEARLALAELAVHSVDAELGCEHARVTVVVEALRDRDDATTRVLTVASLVAAAVTGIVTSALTPVPGATPTEAVIGIVGGVASGVLGVAALFTNAAIVFRHPRNVLRDVWTGPAQSPTFPNLVWAYLTDARYGVGRRAPIRAQLAQSWQRRGLLGRPGVLDPRRAALYLGEGGRYDVDALDTRAAMLSELRAAVRLMEQELELLASETARIP